MGNLSIKARDEESTLFSARSPLRNRNFEDPTVKHLSKAVKEPMIVKNNLLSVALNNVERQRILREETKKSDVYEDPIVKPTRKVKSRRAQNEEVSKGKDKKENNAKNVGKVSSDQYEKKTPFELRTTNEAILISDILKMIIDLERTFLEEKKYQRRLRTGVSKQNEKLHHLQLSLHVEKERNKRLMEILSHSDCLGTGSLEINSNTTKTVEKHDDQKSLGDWPYHGFFSNSIDRPISPMLLQQRNDELQNSLSISQRELQRKDNLLTLALCKQETLQAKCDKLTEQLISLQRKLDAFNRKKIQRKWKVKNPSSETSETKGSVAEQSTRRSHQWFQIQSDQINWDDWERDIVSMQPIQFEKAKEE